MSQNKPILVSGEEESGSRTERRGIHAVFIFIMNSLIYLTIAICSYVLRYKLNNRDFSEFISEFIFAYCI